MTVSWPSSTAFVTATAASRSAAHCGWMAAGPRERVHRTMSRSRSLSSHTLRMGLELLGQDAAAIRGRADRQAARVGVVVGDEDHEGEADHKGDRGGADGVE
jgi:hypothetical protein